MPPIIKHPSKQKLAYIEHKLTLQPIFYPEGGVDKTILLKSFNLLDAVLKQHSKVTVIFLQLHPKHYSTDNSVMSQFLNKFTSRVSKHYKCKITYLWVRERAKSSAQHYHLAIMLNGHLCKSSFFIDKIAEDTWQELDIANFSFKVQNRIYRIERNKDNKVLEAARTRLSYLAKNASKERSKLCRAFGHSRSKRKS